MKIYVTTLLCMVLLAATSQTDYNKWSIGLNIGAHDGHFPTESQTKLYQPHHIDVNGRYMMNNRFGIMLDAGYDKLKFNNGVNTNYWRTSIQGVVNLTDVFNFTDWTSRFGLLFHAGAGMSHLWKEKGAEKGEGDDKVFDHADDMMNWIVGLRPQLKLSERVSLNADLSYVFHSKQTTDFTMTSLNDRFIVDGRFYNVSVGVSFYLGKKNSHADWTPTIYGSDNTDLYNRVKAMEDAMKDNDGDGVPNGRDLDTLTPPDTYVNSRGEEIERQTILDKDSDGFLNTVDECPNVAGTINGCPDRDKDGVADSKDKCPDEAGKVEFNGCNSESQGQESGATSTSSNDLTVYFNTGKAVILKESNPYLDKIVKTLKDNPSYTATVKGYTDNVGADALNINLSQNRAESVKKYLTSNGVTSNRLNAWGLGSVNPAALNDRAIGRAQNRRVEILIFK